MVKRKERALAGCALNNEVSRKITTDHSTHIHFMLQPDHGSLIKYFLTSGARE